MSGIQIYRPLSRRRSGYGLDPLDLFGSLSPRGFMDILNRSNDISTSVGDGSMRYDVNLAGFDQREISVKVDPKTNMLNIDALRSDNGDTVEKSFSIYLGDAKVSASDLKSTYRNGLLSIEVSQPELQAGDVFDVPIDAGDSGQQTLDASPNIINAHTDTTTSNGSDTVSTDAKAA